jgi:SNF2 family DNA or RNA helicase
VIEEESLQFVTDWGKTLQSITLWTLLKQGFDGKLLAKRAMTITPISLANNWEQENTKWLSHSIVNLLAMCESIQADIFRAFLHFCLHRTSIR